MIFISKKFGKATKICRRCLNHSGVITSYGINYCRRCFRLVANSIGFKKYR